MKVQSSPSQAYSDKKAKLDISELREASSTSNFARTNTGFTASSNFSNLKIVTSSKQANNNGVVLLHDMIDRSKVQLVSTRQTKNSSSKPLLSDTSRLVLDSQTDPEKSAQSSQLITGSRTNNFFVGASNNQQQQKKETAVNSSNMVKRQFTMTSLASQSYDTYSTTALHKSL